MAILCIDYGDDLLFECFGRLEKFSQAEDNGGQ